MARIVEFRPELVETFVRVRVRVRLGNLEGRAPAGRSRTR